MKHHRALTATVALGSALAGTPALAAPPIDLPEGWFRFVSRATGRALDGDGAHVPDGQSARVWDNNRHVNQWWFVGAREGHQHTLTSRSHGRFLAVRGDRVVVEPYRDGDRAQLWFAVRDSGDIALVNVASGHTLNAPPRGTANGATVTGAPRREGALEQRWDMAVVTAPLGLVCPYQNRSGAPFPRGRTWFCQDPEGRKHGVYLEWPEHGGHMIEGAYDHGVKDGPWTTWYEVDKRNYSRERFARGQVVEIDHHPGGESFHGYMDHGQRVGLWKHWSGQRLSEETPYEAGQKHGRSTTWDHKGGKCITDYVRGVKHGDHTCWNAANQVTTQGQYVNGQQHGPWVRRTDALQLVSQGTWDHGRRVGLWRFCERDRTCYDEQY